MELLLVALSAWFIAQVVKFSLRALNGKPDFRLFYQSGGMPSAHSATVVALAVAALTTLGYGSPVFGVSVVLAAIVIYDSLGVRRASGEQSVMMNALLKATGNKTLVREILGHTPREVAAGAVLGTVVGLLFTHQHWSAHVSWLAERPDEFEKYVYLGVFAGIVFLGVVGLIMLGRLRSVAITQQLKAAVWNGLILPGLVGAGFLSLLQFQTERAGSWRIWAVLLIAGILVAHVILAFRFYRYARGRYHEQSTALSRLRKEQKRQQKKTKKEKRRKRKK